MGTLRMHAVMAFLPCTTIPLGGLFQGEGKPEFHIIITPLAGLFQKVKGLARLDGRRSLGLVVSAGPALKPPHRRGGGGSSSPTGRGAH